MDYRFCGSVDVAVALGWHTWGPRQQFDEHGKHYIDTFPCPVLDYFIIIPLCGLVNMLYHKACPPDEFALYIMSPHCN